MRIDSKKSNRLWVGCGKNDWIDMENPIMMVTHIISPNRNEAVIGLGTKELLLKHIEDPTIMSLEMLTGGKDDTQRKNHKLR